MAPRIPPLRTEFLKITYDLEGRIAGMVMSPEWQQYFAQSQQFQEAVGVALNLSDIQDALDTTRESLESTLETDVQAIIDAGAAIQFGADYQGKWAAGNYAVGEVVYYSGYFYECEVARISSHTDNPATDTAGWSLRVYEVMLTGDVNVDLSSLENSIQNAIDAQGTAAFGEDYQGVWAAGAFSIGNVAYHAGAFYTCTVARTSSNTDDPAADTSSWSIQVSESGGLDAAVQAAIDASATIQFGESYTGVWERGVHAVGDIVYFFSDFRGGKFYECTMARTNSHATDPSLNASAWDAVGSRRDSLGYANFGANYKGQWAPGVFAVGDVTFYGGRFYECSVARVAAENNNPATDASSWDVVGSSVDLSSVESSLGDLDAKLDSTRTDISAAIQAQIDAIGANAYGDSYQGAWSAGAYAVGNVAYHDGMFYECSTTRTSSNTDNPASDTASWDVADSSVTVDLGSIETMLSDLETEVGSARTDISDAIQAQIDAIGANAYGDLYKGEWAPAAFAIGDVVYHVGKFYECDVPRTSSNTNNPTINTGAWTVVASTVTVDFSSIESTLASLETALDSARTDIGDARQAQIDAIGASAYGGDYEGVWEAGIFDVGEVVYSSGFFYECDAARASGDTDDPATDTASWSVIRSSTEVDLSSIEGTLADLETEITDARNAQIEAIGAATYGDSWEGIWEAGAYAVGDVAHYGGRFYECSAARDASDTDNPATDAASWDVVGSSITVNLGDTPVTVDLSGLESDISEARQAQIDAIGSSVFGGDYEGVWEAGIFDVGEVVYSSGFFYECDAARASGDTDDPATDTASWSVIRSSTEVDLSSIEGTLADLETEITDARNAQIEAIGAATYGDSWEGIWEAGAYAVGDVAHYGGRFYECSAARDASDTDNPATDAASWDVVGSSITVDLSSIESTLASLETGLDSTRNDISDAAQAQIDAIGANAYGEEYQGAWAPGAFAVGNVAYYDGMFYTCTVARTASNMGNPATATASWDVADSSVTVDLGSIETMLSDLETEVGSARTDISDAIQAQIDAIGANAYGDLYKGEWAAGAFAIGDVVYHVGKFYECDVPRTSSNTNNPTINTGAWTVVASTVTVDFSSIESTLSDLETELDSARTDIGDARQEQIDAAARIAYGEDYQGVWAAGNFAVGDVVFHAENFYECDQTRTSANTSNPAVNTTAWSIIQSLKQGQAETLLELTHAVQDTIDAQARAIFGTDYRGTWEAGDLAVGDVTYWIGKFYRCTVRRQPTDTDDPATDTASWELTGTDTQAIIDAAARTAFGDAYTGLWVVGVHAVGDVTYFSGNFYECVNARNANHMNPPTINTGAWDVKESVESRINSAVQDAIDAGVESVGAAQFGEEFQGAWEAGVHAVGDIRSFERRYYRCKVARTSGNTTDPASDNTGWEIIGSATTILAQRQSTIDTIGASNYGDRYQGVWEAGIHAAGDYRSHDGRYYLCKVARTSSNTSDPAADNTGWEAVGSSFALEGSLETASQAQIDAAASIVFGSDYQGVWAPGIFAVGNVAYDSTEKSFYECDVARTASNTSRPAINSSSWTVIVAREAGVYAARDRAVSTLPTNAKDGDLIWVAGDLVFGSWDDGIAVPSGVISPKGVAVKANGDIVIVGSFTRRVYTYSNGSWDSGIAVPSGETDPVGVAVKANGDIVIVGTTTDRVYTYSNGSWDSGIAVPSGVTSPQGVAVKANGDIVIVGILFDKVYTYSNGSWDSGIAVPSGETNPQGVAVKANGDILLVGSTTDRVYTYSNGSWDSGIPVPSGESSPAGVGENANGDIVIVGSGSDRVYTSNLLRELDRYIWNNGEWELTAIRAVN